MTKEHHELIAMFDSEFKGLLRTEAPPTHWQPMPAAPSPLQAFANAPLGEGLAAARAVLAASKEAS